MTNPVDIHSHVEAICEAVGVVASYVYRLDIEPQQMTVYCYAGKDGFCDGKKYIVKDEDSRFYGEAALEPPLTIEVTS
jgi:hypothetical protein